MPTLAFLQNLSSWEIILIFLVVLLFFGAKRLPDLFRSFGKSLREFKKATSEIEEDMRTAMDEEPVVKNPVKPKPVTEVAATTAPQEVEPEQTASTDEATTTSPANDAGTDNEDSKPHQA